MTGTFIEREIWCGPEGQRQQGHIRIGQPSYTPQEPDLSHVWSCDLECKWPGKHFKIGVKGEDSYQAMELAMRHAPVEVLISEQFKAGELSLYEDGHALTIDELMSVFYAQHLGEQS